MLVRQARESDSRAIARFIAMAESEMARFLFGADGIREAIPFFEELALSPTENRYSLNNTLVAEIDGEPVGSVVSFPADKQPELDGLLLAVFNKRGLNLEKLFFEGEKGSYYLCAMGVDPDFRGRGVGTALIEAARAKGRERGYDRVSLLVSSDKTRARALYERAGFSVIETVIIGGCDYFRMLTP